MTKSNTAIAAVCSCVIPGSGHFLLARRKAGLAFLSFYLLFLALFALSNLASSFIGLLGSIYALFIYVALAVWSCAFSKTQASRLSKLWLLLFIFLAFVHGIYAIQLTARTVGYRIFQVPSTAMNPTITKDESIVVDANYYKKHDPEHQAVVVFRREGLFIVKRIIAVGGETFEIRNNLFYVNGQQIQEPFITSSGANSGAPWTSNLGPITIPAKYLFVVGDNRPVSYDSRAPEVGPIPSDTLVGRALYIIKSANKNRMGTRLE